MTKATYIFLNDVNLLSETAFWQRYTRSHLLLGDYRTGLQTLLADAIDSVTGGNLC